jgi:hypothetical protein
MSHYQKNPGISHWKVVKGILKYLKNTKDMVLVYGGNEEELSINGYVDASFDTDSDDSKSQTGYVFMLNGGAVSWESCKQDLVALQWSQSIWPPLKQLMKEFNYASTSSRLGCFRAWATLWTSYVTTRSPSPTPRRLELIP